jgi:hypothetical protein
MGNSKSISKKSYEKIWNFYRQKFIEYNGKEPEGILISQMSKSVQMEKYARAVAFWILSRINLDNSENKKKIFIGESYADLIDEIVKKFSEEDKDKIIIRANQLAHYNRNSEIEKSKKILEDTFKLADEYYADAIKNGSNVLDPEKWIDNQDKMRFLYEKFKNVTSEFKSMEGFDNELSKNASYKYSNFMYEFFPPNYGNEFKCWVDNFGFCNESEIFYDLKNGYSICDEKK